MALLAAAAAAGCKFAISTPLQPAQTAPAVGPYVVIVTSASIRPELRAPFVRESRRLLAQMQTAEGLLGASLRVEPFGTRVWTMTAWRTREQARHFADSPAHRQARAAMGHALTSFRSVAREQMAAAWPPTRAKALSWLEEDPAGGPRE